MSPKSFNLLRILAAVFVVLLAGNLCMAQTGQESTNFKMLQAGKEELIQVDRDFAGMAADSGVAKAFTWYAADSATMLRRGSAPIVGHEAIRSLFADETESALLWSPYFADLAASSDIGYTLGTSQYVYKDSTGTQKISYGYYVTIWKKQTDNSWKYVLDTGVSAPPPPETQPAKKP